MWGVREVIWGQAGHAESLARARVSGTTFLVHHFVCISFQLFMEKPLPRAHNALRLGPDLQLSAMAPYCGSKAALSTTMYDPNVKVAQKGLAVPLAICRLSPWTEEAEVTMEG